MEGKRAVSMWTSQATSLDVDGLPSLASANLFDDLDLSLSLRAGSLHIARIGEAQIDSGSLAVNVGQERAEHHAQAPERGGPRWRVPRCRGRDGP